MLKYRTQKQRTKGSFSPVRGRCARIGFLSVGLAVFFLTPAIRADVAPAPEIRELIQEDQDVKIRVAIFSGDNEDVTLGPIVRAGEDEEHTVVDKATLTAAEIKEGDPVCWPTFYYWEEVDCDGDGQAECPGDCDGRLYDFWDPCVPPGPAEYRLEQSPPWASGKTSTLSIEVTDSQIPCDPDEDTESDSEFVEDNDSDAESDSEFVEDNDSDAESDSEFVEDNDSDAESDSESTEDNDSDTQGDVESSEDNDSDTQGDVESSEDNDSEDDDSVTQDGSDAPPGGDSGNGCSAVPTSATPNLFKLILQLL